MSAWPELPNKHFCVLDLDLFSRYILGTHLPKDLQLKSRMYRISGFVLLILVLSLVALDGVTSLPASGTNAAVCRTPQAQNPVLRPDGVELFDKLNFKDFSLVKKYSAEYGVDFRLILALIKQESQFNSDAQSQRGATGFMQLMPVTNAEISEVLEIDSAQSSRENLKIGIYYFAQLFELFKECETEDRICLALAGYNAGPMRIYDAQELAAYMGENPHHWSSIQNVLPLLSKRYYSLHKSVWNVGKPRSGYFGSWRQTSEYVENTVKTYKAYKKILKSATLG